MAVAGGVGVGVGVGDEVADELGDELGVGGLVVGEGDGDDVVGVGEAEGEDDGELDGLAGAEVWPWAGPTKSGGWTGWPVNSRARAAITTPRTTTAPPVATPAANERRSRRYSVVRRSRSQAGPAPAGQRGPAGGPAVDRRGGQAERGEQQQTGQQRPAQLANGQPRLSQQGAAAGGAGSHHG